MTLRVMWFSAVSAVLGAIFWRMLDHQLIGIDLDVIALLLMVAGVVGLSVSSVLFAVRASRHPRGASRSSVSDPVADVETVGALSAAGQPRFAHDDGTAHAHRGARRSSLHLTSN